MGGNSTWLKPHIANILDWVICMHMTVWLYCKLQILAIAIPLRLITWQYFTSKIQQIILNTL